MRFKIDWAGLTVGSQFTFFALFYIVIFQVQAPGGLLFGGAIQWRVFCVTGLGGPIFGGAYFQNFTLINGGEVRKIKS